MGRDAPSGIAEIADTRPDVVSDGDFIEALAESSIPIWYPPCPSASKMAGRIRCRTRHGYDRMRTAAAQTKRGWARVRSRGRGGSADVPCKPRGPPRPPFHSTLRLCSMNPAITPRTVETRGQNAVASSPWRVHRPLGLRRLAVLPDWCPGSASCLHRAFESLVPDRHHADVLASVSGWPYCDLPRSADTALQRAARQRPRLRRGPPDWT